LASSLEATRWDRIASGYQLLDQVAPSPLHLLNLALATAEWRGPVAGLAVLDGWTPPSWLAESHMWSAVLSDLHRRCGHRQAADRFRRDALRDAPSVSVVTLLHRRLVTDHAD
jgi:predicted RNA polymerase sigma factor